MHRATNLLSSSDAHEITVRAGLGGDEAFNMLNFLVKSKRVPLGLSSFLNEL